MGLAWGRVLAVLAIVAPAAVAPPTRAWTDDTPIPAAALFAVRFGGDETRTRLVLDLGDASPGRVTVATADGRLELDLPVAGGAGGEGNGHGLVRHWTASPAGDGARVAFDLAPGVSIERRFAIPPSADVAHWRYVVDLVAGDPVAALLAPHPAAAPAPTSTSTPNASVDRLASADSAQRPAAAPQTYAYPVAARPPSPPAPRAAVVDVGAPKVIVIDPGHGGHDTGAQSLVRNEKDINLAAALALKARLERSGRYHIVLTRSDDTFIPLNERVRIARAARADLFISLHADSAGQDPTPHGATVYTLSDHGVTRVNEVLGPHEWFAKAGDKRADPAVGQLLLDLAQRNTLNRSAEFAGLLINHIGRTVDLVPHGHRDAGYFVLLAPDVPAVLLEMGFITNPADELRLTDPEQRKAMMGEVGDAIDDYFAPHAQVAEADRSP
jgi:N-acetylmuramoyl-L-alanine amidase